MSNLEVNFWSNWSADRTRPIDILVNAQKKDRNPITADTLCDFVYGCKAIAWNITRVQPDFVVYPQRGSVPIDWTIQEITRLNPNDYFHGYERIFPQTGTYFNVDSGKAGGMTYAEKQKTVEFEVAEIKSRWKKDRAPVVLMIDEVSSGSTLVTAVDIMAKKLEREMQVKKMYVVGAQDTRVLGIRQKVEMYSYLTSNIDDTFEMQTINLPLFFMDVAEFLDYPLRLESNNGRQPALNHILHNSEAKDFFITLAKVVQHPELMIQATEHLQKYGSNRQHGNEQVQGHIDYIISLLLPENLEFRLKANNMDIIQFWNELAKIRISQR